LKILVTGANGFIGRALVERILASNGVGDGGSTLNQLTLSDARFDQASSDPRVCQVPGDLADPEGTLNLWDNSNITESYKTAKIYPAKSPLAMECQRLLGVVPPQFNLDHRGQLIRIAATILSVEFKETQTQRAGFVRAEDHMVQVFEKLSASEIINLSVGELADRFNCSRRHLNRLPLPSGQWSRDRRQRRPGLPWRQPNRALRHQPHAALRAMPAKVSINFWPA